MTQPSTSRTRQLRRRIAGAERVLGLFMRIADTVAVEALALSDVDFVVLDAENSALGRPQIDALLAVALACDMPVLVRLPAAQLGDIQHAMMAGAAGVVVSHLSSADQLRDTLAFCRHAGVAKAHAGMGRGTRGRTVPWAEFSRAMADSFIVIAQVDSAATLAQAGPIASAAGLDAVFVGTWTLALDLGAKGSDDQPVQQAIHTIASACKSAGIQLGMHLPPGTAGPHAGLASILVVGNELTAMHSGVQALLAQVKTSLQT